MKYMLTMKYGSDAERKLMKEDADRQWQAEQNYGGDPDDIFSWQGLKDAFNTIQIGRNNIFYSCETFMDFFTFILCLICGFYTLFLFVQTTWYVYKRFSLVDSMKRDRYFRMSKRDREMYKGADYLKIKRPLTY